MVTLPQTNTLTTIIRTQTYARHNHYTKQDTPTMASNSAVTAMADDDNHQLKKILHTINTSCNVLNVSTNKLRHLACKLQNMGATHQQKKQARNAKNLMGVHLICYQLCQH